MFSATSHSLVRRILAVQKTTRNGEGSIIAAGLATVSTNTNYYEALGIPKNSTQTDIKAAYYKLSKQFHPDKNQGCAVSANKFREITQAYEVLGNYRLRRLYDKGAIHKGGIGVADVNYEYPVEEPDDPETKFYKSRFTKSKVADAKGRTPIYNFDEWSRAHYGDSFQRRKEAKQKWERRQKLNEYHILSTQNEILLFGLIVVSSVLYYCFSADQSNYDNPKRLEQKEAEESNKKT